MSRFRTELLILSLLFATATVGCHSVTGLPFGFNRNHSQTLAATPENVPTQPGVNSVNQAATANDAASQRIAAESRALSQNYFAPPNPEVGKYASVRDSASGYAASGERSSESFTSGSSSASGCTSGCCRK